MKSFRISEILLFLILTTSILLNYLSSFLDPMIKFFDDFFILVLFIFLIPFYKRSFFKKDTIIYNWFFILFTIFIFSSIMNYDDLNLYSFFVQLKNYILPFFMYFVAVALYQKEKYKRTLEIYLYIALLISIIAVIEFILKEHLYLVYNVFGSPLNIIPFRSYSIVGSPVDLGFFLIFPIIYSYLLKRFIIFSIFLIALLCTLSLSALSSILLISVLAYFVKILRFKNFLIIFLISFLFWTNNSFYNNRFESKLITFSDKKNIEQATRYNFYVQSYDLIKDNLLLGVGVGNYGGWTARQDTKIYDKYNINLFGLKSIDAFYPHLMGELGVFGFISYLAIYLKFVVQNFRIFKYFRKNFDKLGYTLSASTLLYGSILLYSGFWSMFLETLFSTIIFFFLSAFSFCYFEKINHKNQKNES